MHLPECVDHLTPELQQLICGYLGVDDITKTHNDYGPFEEVRGEEIEEMWMLPEEFVTVLELGDNVSTPGFCYGWIVLGTLNGRKIVAEQNASPFLVYY